MDRFSYSPQVPSEILAVWPARYTHDVGGRSLSLKALYRIRKTMIHVQTNQQTKDPTHPSGSAAHVALGCISCTHVEIDQVQ